MENQEISLREPLLEVRDLNKRFGSVNVLKGISFSLAKGEVLSVIGSSGSGKTTLLRCLNFLETADSGRITVGGKIIFDGSKREKLSEAEIRRRRLTFGLVFQSFNLFPQYTVQRNLTLAPSLMYREQLRKHQITKDMYRDRVDALDRKAEELLSQVGLFEKRDSYPYQLSGGQQQRAAISRALAMEPEILCFDEPTSALDPELTGEVLKVIKGLKSSDRTMIVVTHEMEFARNVSDRVLFMADGVVQEMGTPEEIFEHPQTDRLRSFLNTAYRF